MPCTKNSKLTGSGKPYTGLPFLHLALPVMDEPELLPRLLDCISAQTYRRFTLHVCVNQPEAWWNDPAKESACFHNAAALSLLQNRKEFETVVIDRSSPGNGWTGKRLGVGYARKAVMDQINSHAQPGDIILSLDADTVFSEKFFLSVARNFSTHPDAVALAVPYYHRTGQDELANRAMLRYEIYMRHYFLSLARIGSPYAFTALGSAMAVPVWAYRAVGGMTPKLSGEDFYFLQKLRKYGQVLLWNDETVYPEGRFSDRVFFGTGPAMIRGATGDWASYPVYPVSLFDAILETYLLLPVIYVDSVDTKISRFISQVFRETDPFQPLRTNHRDLEHFIRAFHEKFDGLRILQFLKTMNEDHQTTDEENLIEFLQKVCSSEEIEKTGITRDDFSFADSPVENLEKIRELLFLKETERRFTSVLP